MSLIFGLIEDFAVFVLILLVIAVCLAKMRLFLVLLLDMVKSDLSWRGLIWLVVQGCICFDEQGQVLLGVP